MYIYDLYGGSAVGNTLDRKGQDLPVREAAAILGESQEREVPDSSPKLKSEHAGRISRALCSTDFNSVFAK